MSENEIAQELMLKVRENRRGKCLFVEPSDEQIFLIWEIARDAQKPTE